MLIESPLEMSGGIGGTKGLCSTNEIVKRLKVINLTRKYPLIRSALLLKKHAKAPFSTVSPSVYYLLLFVLILNGKYKGHQRINPVNTNNQPTFAHTQ